MDSIVAVTAIDMVLFLILTIVLGVPLGISMGIMGFVGLVALRGLEGALSSLFTIPFSATASWSLSVIPMFVIMGSVVSYAGFAEDAYRAAYKWVGRLPGGLAVATLVGSAFFGAASGSSIAATATLGRICIPEMRRFNYNIRFAAGCVCVGGTIDAIIPPSILLVVIGIITEQSVGKLLISGILPGILTTVVYIVLCIAWATINPRIAPKGEAFPWRERFKDSLLFIPIVIVFVVSIGGLLVGLFTPTEGGAVGAIVTLIMALGMKTMSWSKLKKAVSEGVRVTCTIFTVIVGAYIFIQFLAVSRLPIMFGEWVVGLPIPPLGVFIGLVIVYLIFGCFLDALGNLLLTVPFVFHGMVALGFDGIWLSIIICKLIELGMITPPVGLQAFVLRGVCPDISLKDIFIGFVPFFLVDLLVTIPILYVFPQIVTFLPNLMR